MEILSLPLSSLNSQYKLIWTESKSLTFSMKSAYQVAIRPQQSDCGKHSTAGDERPLWQKLWSLNVPPKVCTFFQRACSNILPTRANLHRRKVNIYPRCEICCQHTKTTGHLLQECPLASNVWALSKGRIQKCQNHAQDFFLLFKILVGKLEKKDVLETWATISWAIWSARNKFYFE